MNNILLAGVALNFFGAFKLLATALAEMSRPPSGSQEYLQFKLFTAGAAAVFGSLYLYLYLHPESAKPFLVFGAALKTWALMLSLLLYFAERMSRRAMLEFGVSNGVVAGLFWWYLAALP